MTLNKYSWNYHGINCYNLSYIQEVKTGVNHKILFNVNFNVMAHLFSATAWHCHFSSSQTWSVLNVFTQSYLPSTRFIPSRTEPHLEHLHLQFSTAVTHCLLDGTHFTYPERMVACVKLERAASASWIRAVGVRGECYHSATCSQIFQIVLLCRLLLQTLLMFSAWGLLFMFW